jgi:hypothetical protein
VGDGGIVLGLRLGDGAFDHVGDHAAPGVCLVHPDADAGHALSALSCIGNLVEVRTGEAASAHGVIAGKRGGGGRVIAVFAQDVLERLRPGDQVAVRSIGRGADGPLPAITQHNIAPAAIDLLPARVVDGVLRVGVRAVVPSRMVGNGIGRPMPLWDVDLQVSSATPEVANLRLGDLVAITDLDARFNAGYRKGWVSIGVLVHGSSPQPGHGPGVTIIWTGPSYTFDVRVESDHRGLDESTLLAHADKQD